MGRRPIHCRSVVELVTDYLEDVLPPARRNGVRSHLATCPGCTIYLQQMRATIRLTALLPRTP